MQARRGPTPAGARRGPVREAARTGAASLLATAALGLTLAAGGGTANGGFTGGVTSTGAFTSGTHVIADVIGSSTCRSSANSPGAIATNSGTCTSPAATAIDRE